MSDVHNIKQQQLSLALFIKEDNHSPIIDALWPKDGQEFAGADHFTKKALFTPITYFDSEEDKEKRMSFFQFKSVLDKLPEIAAYLAEKGEPLTAADFLAPHSLTKKAFEFITEIKGGAYQLIDPQLWAGRSEDIEKLFDELKLPQRKAFEQQGLTREYLSREAARAGGAVFRDEILEERGVKQEDIVEAAKTGNFEPVLEKLKQHDDTLTKEDLMLAEIWVHDEVWEHYDKIHEILSSNGEPMEAADFDISMQKENEQTPSKILYMAHGTSHARKLYDPEKWIGRSDDFRQLLKNSGTKQEKMKQAGFTRGDLLAQLIDLEHKDQLEKRDGSAFSFPTTPFHSISDEFQDAGEEKNKSGVSKSPVTPLGLLSVWKALDESALDALEQAGTPLLPEHIEAIAGYEDETGLTTAIRAGRLDIVLNVYQRAGQVLTPEILRKQTRLYDSPNTLIKEKDMIPDLFTPEAWIGHTKEMKHLWKECLEVQEKNKVTMIDLQFLVERLTAAERAQHINTTPYGFDM